MIKQKIALQISLLTLGLFFVCSSATFAEVIKSFDSKITVNTDASVTVVETIFYDSEGLVRHGLLRDIRPISSEGKIMAIKDISVTEPDGTPIQWRRESNNGDVRLRIGDPDVTFSGVKTYVITYTATNAVAHLQNGKDEIYWNATGNEWPFTIEKFTAQVLLPNTVHESQNACYTGPIGSTTQGCFAGSGGFYSNQVFVAGEGATVAVGFPSGSVFDHVPTGKEKLLALIGKFWPILMPIIIFTVSFRKWYRKGRDDKGRGVIIPEYEVIDGLTPLEASVVINQKFTGRDLIAEILFLATKGYISITQTEEKKLLGKKIDYTLTLKKIPSEELANFDSQLLKEIFDPEGDTDLIVGMAIILSQSYSLFGITTSLSTKIKERLVDSGYYTKDFLPKSISMSFKKFRNVFALIVIFGFFAIKYLSTQTENITAIFFSEEVTILIFIGSIILSAMIGAFFQNIMPAKTKKGALAKEHLLGLREYIKVAEKDRIAFHNAPEINTALFERLLPYAVMFGLEKKWAKAFEGITLPPPSWYSSTGSGFVPALFVADFSNNFSSSFFTAPSSSGSGGGGFSGGGGGGGGGGSW